MEKTNKHNLITVQFWGGPRDGDVAYQIQTPPDLYIIPIFAAISDLFGFPVDASVEEGPIWEAHVYELSSWKNPRSALYTYKGVQKFND